MTAFFRAWIIVCALLAPAGVDAAASNITPKARKIVATLLTLDVEHKWIAGRHIDWLSGEPDRDPETLPGRHTHCSAFVAAAAQSLGVYILRPPQHGQVLLANAQNEWLASAGAREGWERARGPAEAQDLANQGYLVVASYHNHFDDKPGHIAIVLPGAKSPAILQEEGPDVMQAGAVNSASIALRDGFAGHRHAWLDQEVEFFAHEVNAR